MCPNWRLLGSWRRANYKQGILLVRSAFVAFSDWPKLEARGGRGIQGRYQLSIKFWTFGADFYRIMGSPTGLPLERAICFLANLT